MPLYDFQCPGCGYRSNTFVWNMHNKVICPHCGETMMRLFTTSNMILLNRQKPRCFKHNPEECNADKDIWKTVIEDQKRGNLAPGELEFWKKEVSKNNPDVIL